MSSYLTPPPMALAHRGGAGMPGNAGIENSLEAFRRAVALGYRYIETDVQASSDGVAFAFHDNDFGRIAPDSPFGVTPLISLTAEQIRSVLLAGEPVPTVAELLGTFPETRFNIDVKTASGIEPTVRAIREADATDRVLIASFSDSRLTAARRLLPGIATSTGPREVAVMRLCPRLLGWWVGRRGAVCLQVPERWHRVTLVTPRFIAAAHRRGLQVHVWTVDDPADMTRLLDMGVDGLVTDRPEVLKDVLLARGQWP